MITPAKSASPEQSPAQDCGLGAGPPSLAEIFISFLRLGAISFGGPAMVAYIKRLAVEQKTWLPEEDFKSGVALCQAIPGATAMQCAAFVGLRLRGLAGSFAGYVGFGLPAFLVMLAVSIAYRQAVQVEWIASALTGLRCIAVALVANAAWSFGRASMKGVRDGLLALVAAAMFFAGANPFFIVIGVGLLGPVVLARPCRPTRSDVDTLPGWRFFRNASIILVVGAAAMGILFVLSPRLAVLGLVMMKIDAFAFGGGFASVPLMFREVVHARAWLPAGTFMDGIALGQVTPGPIVITATFAGYQIAGIAGAVVATAGIFLPSILAVTLAEPWFRRLGASPFFDATSRALVLSFVGLLVSVTVQFARIAPWSIGSGVVSVLCLAALLRKVDVVWVVLVGGVLAAVAHRNGLG